MDEMKEMQRLNDRLALYIERVRSLELENNSLTQQVREEDGREGREETWADRHSYRVFQITTIEETKSTEMVTMRNAYHAELEQLRRALDETSKERARCQVGK